MHQHTETSPQAAQARFALAFPVLLLLSVGAHLVAGGQLPGLPGLFAGAVFAALSTALAARSRLTVAGLSAAALASQLAVHWSFEFVTTLGGVDHSHHHGGQPVASGAASAVAAPSGHGFMDMFTSPMFLAHGAAAVLVAIMLVRIDGFLAYLRSAVVKLITILRSQELIVHRPASAVFVVDKLAGLPPVLSPLSKRGPPALPRFFSKTSVECFSPA